MKFIAICSTEDSRLTEGKIYLGNIVTIAEGWIGTPEFEQRIMVFDNKNEWMTFNPEVFRPAEVLND